MHLCLVQLSEAHHQRWRLTLQKCIFSGIAEEIRSTSSRHHAIPPPGKWASRGKQQRSQEQFKEDNSSRWKILATQASRCTMGLLDSIQDTHWDVSLLAYLRESLPSSNWARASSLLHYQEAQPIFGWSRETTTSPASGVIGAEAWQAQEHDNLQGEDEGLPGPTHLTMIISGQWQGLALNSRLKLFPGKLRSG